MTGATDLFEDDVLDLLFTNVDCPNVGDSDGLQKSVADGDWHISLHTGTTISDSTTTQDTAEAAYSGYGRVAVPRNISDWTVATGTADNDSAITYTISADGPETETDVGLGFATSGATPLQIWSLLDAPLVVNIGVTPEFAAQALAISLD
jgi:hypothetical protein